MPNSPTEQARRELGGVLKGAAHVSLDRDGITYGQLTDHNGHVDENVINKVMAWHLRHAPQPPTREAIRKVLEHHCTIRVPHHEDKHLVADSHALLDDLLALFRPASLSQGSGPKVWCQHWEYVTEKYGKPGWYGTGKDLISNPDNSWDICPVKDCHAPRPEGGDGE